MSMFYGAVIDGPAFGENRGSELPYLRVQLYGRTPELSQLQAHVPVSMLAHNVMEYYWHAPRGQGPNGYWSRRVPRRSPRQR